MITIVDYGMGNLGSVRNMFKRIGINTETASTPEQIKCAKKILLPGVGAFDTAISRIDNGFREVLNQKALVEQVPILGICLGMQLLTRSSEEGILPGLGWIDAITLKFRFTSGAGLKVPNMGWNSVQKTNKSPLIDSLTDNSRFYFVHSYYVKCNLEDNVLMRTNYGIIYDSVITNGKNIFGAQFHPEKSHSYGMQLLKNFSEI